MDDRARRVAANEAVARQVNEELTPLQVTDSLALLCECGSRECHATHEVSRSEYEEVRANPTRFLVVIGHDLPDVESVVSTRGEHAVVEKDDPEARDLARRTDPRK
jgi:hypothetical protein